MPDAEHDYESLLWSESADLVALMVLGHTTPMPVMVALIAKHGFNRSSSLPPRLRPGTARPIRRPSCATPPSVAS